MRLLRFLFTAFVASLCVSVSAQEDGAAVSKKAPSVSVEGEVSRPGDIRFPQGRDLAIVDAISLAGGPTRNADLKRVWLIRTTASGGTEKSVIDVLAIWKDPSLKAPTLRGGDRIVIIRRDIDG